MDTELATWRSITRWRYHEPKTRGRVGGHLDPLDDALGRSTSTSPSIDGLSAMKASIMNGQGAGVKAEQVKLEAMENGKAANKAPKAGADGKTVDPSGYDEKTKQKAERIVEKEKYKDVNFWQEHKKELWEMLPFL